ncbi:MAG TPA: winged helix-turn-helix domain-containing protein, partial [Clostridia bacterium]
VSAEAECLLLSDKTCCKLLPDQVSRTGMQITSRLVAARSAGNERLTRWYEWLMIAVHYYAGKFPEAVDSRRAAEGIPREEMDQLGKASLHYYAVKALQIMDEREDARRLGEGWDVCPAEIHALTSETWNALLLTADTRLSEMTRDRMDRKPFDDTRLDALFARMREYAAFFSGNRMLEATTSVMENHAAILRGGDVRSLAEEMRRLQDACLPSVYLPAMGRVATALLADDYVDDAARIVEECFERNEKDNLPYIAAMFYNLMACIAIHNRQDTVAAEYVRASVALAARSRMVSLYADREIFEPVINIAVDDNLEPEFLRTVIDRFDYKIKKIFVSCFGEFYAAPIKAQDRRMHFRTNKTRELLAYLLHNRGRAVTKSELSTQLFGDDSIRNNKLLDVTIYYLRAAFRSMDLDNPVLFQDGGYSIFDNQIECGIPEAANAILAFRRFPSRLTAEAVISAIPDGYMSDIESPWASIQRDLYAELVHMARQTIEA